MNQDELKVSSLMRTKIYMFGSIRKQTKVFFEKREGREAKGMGKESKVFESIS
jgi:hypothetical protein